MISVCYLSAFPAYLGKVCICLHMQLYSYILNICILIQVIPSQLINGGMNCTLYVTRHEGWGTVGARAEAGAEARAGAGAEARAGAGAEARAKAHTDGLTLA